MNQVPHPAQAGSERRNGNGAPAGMPGGATATTPSHELLDAVRPRIAAALDALRAGQTVVVVEDRPGGAVYGFAAGILTTTEALNELVSVCGGVIAVTVDDARADALDLPLIERKRAAPWTPMYAVSVEAAVGVSTGISAADRALTSVALCDPATTARDLVRPGHIMPIRVARLGVLRRPYGPEAAHNLVQAAGLHGGAVLAHVIEGNDDVTVETAQAFADRRGLPLVLTSDVALWRATHEELVRVLERGELAAAAGKFMVEVYQSDLDGAPHLALVRGELAAGGPPLVRIHSQCLTGDVLHSQRCDCGAQLQGALAAVAAEERGAVLYLSQEGRGIGLIGKIQAYALQDQGRDTVDANLDLGFAADQRDYAVAAQMLRRNGVSAIRLLTNNPDKVRAMERLGIRVVETVPLEFAALADNRAYLRTKRDRLGHALRLDEGGRP